MNVLSVYPYQPTLPYGTWPVYSQADPGISYAYAPSTAYAYPAWPSNNAYSAQPLTTTWGMPTNPTIIPTTADPISQPETSFLDKAAWVAPGTVPPASSPSSITIPPTVVTLQRVAEHNLKTVLKAFLRGIVITAIPALALSIYTLKNQKGSLQWGRITRSLTGMIGRTLIAIVIGGCANIVWTFRDKFKKVLYQKESPWIVFGGEPRR